MTDFDRDKLNQELNDLELVAQAIQRYDETDAYHARLHTDYRLWHHYYSPEHGDQWPEDELARPGMIHMTHNIVRPMVDTEARIESKLPRVSLQANSRESEEVLRAERSEKLMLNFLDISAWNVWLNTLNKCRGIYGKGVIKVFWNDFEKGVPPRPDAVVVENPANLRIGWGASDFSVKDWAIYEYQISPFRFMELYPDFVAVPTKGERPLSVVKSAGDHADPLEQLTPNRYPRYQPSDYENKHITVWDYWTRWEGKIVEAIICNGVLVKKAVHAELPDIPYIVIEFDHEPGSPEGIPLVRDLIDLQVEINRALSHFAQLVNDEVDPAWQLTGDNSDSVPPGMIPHGGEITPAGQGNEIKPILKGVNQFPIRELVDELYKAAHFGTGLPEIMFSMPPGAQTAGRALQIQIEASANRIEPRRDLLYEGLKQLLIFWTVMMERKNPKVAGHSVGDLVRGLRRWKFIAPEITPRDVFEHTRNVIDKVNGKLISVEDGMDELGVDSPLEMMKKIERERTNPKYFPGDTQAYGAVIQLFMGMIPMMQQLGIDPAALGLVGSAAQDAQGQQQLEAQQAQPSMDQADGGEKLARPMSQPGSPPPAGGPAPNVANQTLIRNTPTGGAQALQQIKLGGQG